MLPTTCTSILVEDAIGNGMIPPTATTNSGKILIVTLSVVLPQDSLSTVKVRIALCAAKSASLGL